jgi:hypothetical protein
MAQYPPPLEIVPIFNSSNFIDEDEPLTYSTASGLFLKYPFAQGTENLLDTNVNGNLSVSKLGTINEIISSFENQVSINNASLDIIPYSSGAPSSYNPICVGGDQVILANGNQGSQALTITTNSATNAGVRIANEYVYISAGGTSGIGTTSVFVNGNAGTITLTTPINVPTLTAPPPPTTDNSSKIATTQWVQSVIPKIPAIRMYSRWNNTNLSGCRFNIGKTGGGIIGISDTNSTLTIRLTINMSWGNGATPTNNNFYNTDSVYNGIINIYPYQLIDATYWQQQFTQFLTPTTPVGINCIGAYLGFDPVGNRFSGILSGTYANVFTPPVPGQNYWITCASVSPPTNSSLDLTSQVANFNYPITNAIWLKQRWAYTLTSTSQNVYPGQSNWPVLQIIPYFNAPQDQVGIQIIAMNPNLLYTAPGYNPSTTYYNDASIVCEIIDQGNFTVNGAGDLNPSFTTYFTGFA